MSGGVQVEVKAINVWHDEPAHGSDHFVVNVEVFIGEVGEDKVDSFNLVCASPSMLAELYSSDRWGEPRLVQDVLPGGNVLPLTGVWLMKAWSKRDLEAALSRLAPAYSPGPDFGTVASRIARVVPWEYDYRHDDRLNQVAGLPRLSRSFWHNEYDTE